MYGNIIVSVNVIILILMIVVILVILNKSYKSMFNYTYMLAPCLIYIFPVAISVANTIINFKYKVGIVFWVIGFTPMIIPIIGSLYGIKSTKNNKRMYIKHSESIKLCIINHLKRLNICINENQIKLFMNKMGKERYCKVILKLKLKIGDREIIILKTDIEALLREKYNSIKFEVFLDNSIDI